MSLKYDVSIIIVNYNGKKYIDNLFSSLGNLNCPDFTFETVFVDNNSSDDSIEYLRSLSVDEKIHLSIVESKANLGFAGGNNLGVKNSSGKHIVLLNNDTAVDKNWLTNLYHYFISHDYGIVNSKLLFFYDFIKFTFKTQDKIIFNRVIKINGQDYKIDNKFCKNLLCDPETITAFGHSEISIPLIQKSANYSFLINAEFFNRGTDSILCCDKEFKVGENGNFSITLENSEIEKKKYSLVQNAGSFVNESFDGGDIGFCEIDSPKFNKEYEINNACGAAIIFTKDDFEKAGGFDERFFMYYEDTDLSYRIKKLGRKLAYCPDALVRHIHTGSSTEWSPFFVYHVIRNKLLFVWKNISKKKALCLVFRQYASGLWLNDKMKRKAALDALKIIIGMKNVSYREF